MSDAPTPNVPPALPPGFRRFTKEDYWCYAGANAFPDGQEPIIGTVSLKENDQVEQHDVVVSADESDPTKVIFGVMFEQVNANDTSEFQREVESLEVALELIQLLARLQPLTRLQLSAMAFKAL
jgi:hypothetical protein